MPSTSLKRTNDEASEGSSRPGKAPKLDEPTDDGKLIQLLDFTTLSTQDDVAVRFDHLAQTLLEKYWLCVSVPTKQATLQTPGTSAVKEYKFEILELEFYLRKEGCHEDPFAHGSEEQRASGRWYFHRAPRRSEDSSRSATSLTGYRGGTRKGLDLTLGAPVLSTIPATGQPSSSSSSVDVRGGALLRTLRSVPSSDGGTAKITSGPSLLVDEVLRLTQVSSIKELVQTIWDEDTSAFASSSHSSRPALYLKKRPSAPGNLTIYKSPRIGLELSHPGTTAELTHPRVVFVAKRYRYFAHPNLLVKNGRPQTLLGVRSAVIESGKADGEEDQDELIASIAQLTSMKANAVKKLLEEYDDGKAKGKLESFVGPKGKGVGSQPAAYMRMMGLLSRE